MNIKNKILVSACLTGVKCRYDGKANLCKDNIFEKWMNEGVLVPVCPEVMGGLPTPRYPSEIKDGKVINNHNEDVTENFVGGAEAALKIAKENNAVIAILKEKSPSCGSSLIYDGNFCGNKIKGMGITAKLLSDNGIKVFSEENIQEAKAFYEKF